ncbi:MAG: nuclear transport factor 2 family protein, partial [Candidatus Nanopelagicales bacterium]
MSAMQDPNADGEALYREFVAAVAAGNWDLVGAVLADDFQSVHTDGPRDKAKEIEMLKAVNLGNYSLTDFTSTRSGDTLVAT